MSLSRIRMFARSIRKSCSEGAASISAASFSRLPGDLFRCLVIAGCVLLSALVFQSDVLASDLSEFLGRRVTRVDVVIEGAPNSNVAEMKSLVDVAANQDFSPVRVHDSLIRLYKSGLISGARVEASKDS